jgi:hypothetical protein
MFRSALALLSMLQVGTRVRESFDRLRWQAIIIAVAVLFFIAAVAFGLLAAYRELVSIYQQPEAAALMALALLLIGILALWSLQLMAPKRERRRVLISPTRGRNPIEVMNGAMRQTGPVPLVLIAFAGGVLAGRR